MNESDVTRDDLTAWAARLGYDPADVYEISLQPNKIIVRSYRRRNGHTYLCDCGNIASQLDVLTLVNEEDQ